LVVIHDSDFMKVAGASVKVWDATLDEVRALDVGTRVSPEFAGERVPLLEEVLLASRGRAGVLVELKYYGHDQRLEERVFEIVERTGTVEDVMVMSLNPSGVAKTRKLRPRWKVGLLSAASISDLTRVDADFLAVSLSMATPRFIRAAHRAGKEVFVWTVNDAFTMSLVMSRGADGVITDHPALGRQVLAERAELGTAERLLLETALWFGVEPRSIDP
jgi:glycerophosphoryl diester phosphodiesterase